MAIELTKADIIQEATASGAGSGNDLKQLDNLLNMVFSYADKFKKFEEMFGRKPENKQEAKMGRPLNQISAPTNATAEQEINKVREENMQLRKQIDEIAKMNIYIKVEDDKLDNLINSLFSLAEDIPNNYKEMSLNKILSFKGMFKGKIKTYIKEKIPEVVSIETRRKED